MVKIIFNGNKITFEGHTYPDICAAVSSIMYTTANLLDKYSSIVKENVLKFTDKFQSTWYLKANGVVKSVGIIKFPTRPILAAPDEHYCEECAAGDGIRRTNALVLSAPRLVVA